MVAKFAFVTGGVVSDLGKGITAASLGRLLKSRGLRVTMQKFDPYLSVDPGTMDPFQRGEVFITDDSAETDLDLGHYERSIDENLTQNSNVTSGRVYRNVLQKERNGGYGGTTVQAIPHTTSEIKSRITTGKENVDVAIIEVGGTVGGIESQPSLEATRQFAVEIGRNNYLLIYVTPVSYLVASHGQKIKPTQHSVRELLSIGIQPDTIVLRSELSADEDQKKKIVLFCNVKESYVIQNSDPPLLYSAPLALEEERLDDIVCKHFGLDTHGADLTEQIKMANIAMALTETATIAMMGKYADLYDAYLSVAETLTHGGIGNYVEVDIHWVDFELIMSENVAEVLKGAQGILVPSDFGQHGIEGKITAIRYARGRKVPSLGICLGMQMVIVEYSRHVPGLEDANSAEFDLQTSNPAIDPMPEQKDVVQLGGTMCLGKYPCKLLVGSKASELYDEQPLISECYRHRYEVNNDYRDRLEAIGIIFRGRSPGNRIAEMMELLNHPWFMGAQLYPEFEPRPNRPHPLLRGSVDAAREYKRETSIEQYHLRQ